MNRVIKFRGKSLISGEWVYGSLLQWTSESATIFVYMNGKILGSVQVIPETVGQYTGLADIGGEEIFEGDIVDVVKEDNHWNGKEIAILRGPITYIPNVLTFRIGKIGYLAPQHREYVVRVVGNIHDNPEMFKQSAE